MSDGLAIFGEFAPDGRVVCAEGVKEPGDLYDCEVEKCILTAVQNIEFSEPGSYVEVEHAIYFHGPPSAEEDAMPEPLATPPRMY